MSELVEVTEGAVRNRRRGGRKASTRERTAEKPPPPVEAPELEDLAEDLAGAEAGPALEVVDCGPDERKTSTYLSTGDGLFRRRFDKDGDEITAVPLTNFNAFIRAQVVEDDGAETRQMFELEATIDGRTVQFVLAAERFHAMNWPIERLGPGAIVYPGQATRDHTRVAIQMFSRKDGFAARTVFRHTGWREIDGQPIYLHAGGAIGRGGTVSGVEVDLGEKLSFFRLPDPPGAEQLARAINTSLSIANTIAPALAVALLGAVYRAPLGGTDMSVCAAGRTGARKSTAAALAQQHFGAEMDRLKLPENWSSTDNALEMSAFLAKDAVLTIDEFKPGSSLSEAQKLQAKAGRILQAVGNHSGRGRLRADLTARPDRRPRGLILVTGEDIPHGESTRARTAIVEVGPADVPLGQRLDGLQQAARDGVLAEAMAGYVQWLAGRYQARVKGWRKDFEALRVRFQARHARTPEVMAHLALGWRYWLDFAVEVGALDVGTSAQWFEFAMVELAKLADAQGKLQAEADPVHRFLDLLGQAITTGRAHVTRRSDGARPGAELWDSDGAALSRKWGWRHDREKGEWKASGPHIGWIDDEGLYLVPAAAHRAAQEMATAGGEALPIGPKTLGRRLQEAGFLASVTSAEEARVGKRCDGSPVRVLHLNPMALSPSTVSATSATNGDGSPNQAIRGVADAKSGSATVADLSATPEAAADERCRSFGNSCRSPEPIGNGSNALPGAVSAQVLPTLPITRTNGGPGEILASAGEL